MSVMLGLELWSHMPRGRPRSTAARSRSHERVDLVFPRTTRKKQPWLLLSSPVSDAPCAKFSVLCGSSPRFSCTTSRFGASGVGTLARPDASNWRVAPSAKRVAGIWRFLLPCPVPFPMAVVLVTFSHDALSAAGSFMVLTDCCGCRPKRCMGRTESPDLKRLRAILSWHGTDPTRAKWRSSPSACRRVLENCLTPPTLSATRFFNNNHERPPDSTQVRPCARLTNQRGANKIGCAMQAGARESMPPTKGAATIAGASHNGRMIFDRETVFWACSKTVFEVKKEIPDGLSILFYTRDI